MSWLRPIWVRVSLAVLVLLLVVMLRSCAACGFWRPSTHSVGELPRACAILTTSQGWLAALGGTFDPQWRNIGQRKGYYRTTSKEWQGAIVHYQIRQRSDRSRLIRLGAGNSDPGAALASRTVFLRQGNRLVPASIQDWTAASPIADGLSEYFSRVKTSYSPSEPGVQSFHEAGVLGVRRLGAVFSYRGPPEGNTMRLVDLWALKHTAYVEFFRDEMRLPGMWFEYEYCGDEVWTRYAAAWAGEVIFTMPLSFDGNTFVMCDLAEPGV